MNIENQTENKQKFFKLIYEEIKNFAGLVSLISLLLGGFTLWKYLTSLNLAYMLTADLNLFILTGLFCSGYLLMISIIYIILVIVPISSVIVTTEYLNETKNKAPTVKKPQNEFNNNRVNKAWIIAFSIPLIAFFIYIFLTSQCDIDETVFFITMYICILIATINISKSYKEPTSETIKKKETKPCSWIKSAKLEIKNSKIYQYIQKKFNVPILELVFIFQVSLLVMISATPIVIFISIINSSGIKNSIISYLILIVTCIIYVLVFALAIANRKMAYKAISISGVLFLVLIHIFNMDGVLQLATQITGVRDRVENLDYVYKVKAYDVGEDKLFPFKTDTKNHYKTSKDYIYFDAFAVFSFRKHLVLCSKTQDSSTISIEECADFSDVKFQRVSMKFYNQLKDDDLKNLTP